MSTEVLAASRLRVVAEQDKRQTSLLQAQHKAVAELKKKFPDGQVAKWPKRLDAIKIINKLGFVDQITNKPVIQNNWRTAKGESSVMHGRQLWVWYPGLWDDQQGIKLDYETGKVHISGGNS